MTKPNEQFNPIRWFQVNHLKLIMIFLFLYLLFSILAPILMYAGYPKMSKLIYRGYSNLCHQYAYRSWFLFGKQAHYPLESKDGYLSVFEMFEIPKNTPEVSREIIGNPTAGYKVAICQRDIALYGALLLFSLIYQFFGKRIKKLPIGIWLLFAVFPIGMDGLWQLATSYQLLNAQYESSPLMRTVTGVMFGFFSGWLLFPAIEQSLQTKEIRNDNPSQ